ncbi:hypothetical protein NBRC10512v2_000672 [Rhodotorula toruloides]|uniref:Ubiquitin-protein ligase n=1 Tax=Rhodotorula toruloides (strain NP11) TaxID=1130832 RepID=M7WS95_RHOT1|nr:ubiquitin-protein ligase [Rhodotorula toruloides NP11]EMS23447.1 ubiquitin-protein ligase [Rhodotorula toruloides NP11]
MPGAPLESFLDAVPEPLICAEAAYPPVIACDAEHVFCDGCLKQVRDGEGAAQGCPTCRQPLQEQRVSMVLKRVLDGLKFKCRYGGSGCEWAAAAGEEEAHAKGDCDFRLIRCEHCNGDRLAKDFPRHAHMCAEWPVDCSNKANGCVTSIKRGQVDAHTSVCPYNKCINYDQCNTSTTKELLLVHEAACTRLLTRLREAETARRNDSITRYRSSISSKAPEVAVGGGREGPLGCYPRRITGGSHSPTRDDSNLWGTLQLGMAGAKRGLAEDSPSPQKKRCKEEVVFLDD